MKKTNLWLAVTAIAAIAATSASAQNGTENHSARIPAGANVSSIRFQGVKTVALPQGTTYTMDARYCEQAALRAPGGSMFCPAWQAASFSRVYAVTYSYEGQPLASDESGNTRFTFSVYFRPEELDPAAREFLSRRKNARADAAGFFEVTASRETEPRLVIDETRTTYCERTYADGVAMQKDSGCEDNVQYRTLALPSDYVTVRVTQTPVRQAAFSRN